MESDLRQVDIRRLLAEKSLGQLRGKLSALNNDIRVAQVSDWPQAIDSLYPEAVPKRTRIPGLSTATAASNAQALMLGDLRQVVAVRSSVCNDKIAVITAIVGSSSKIEDLQNVGSVMQKLDAELAEISRTEVRDSMTVEEFETDVSLFQTQFEAANDAPPLTSSDTKISLPTTHAAQTSPRSPPTSHIKPAEPGAPQSPKVKKDTVEGRTPSKMGMFFKKYMGGDKEKDKKKRSADDSEVSRSSSSSALASGTGTNSESSLALMEDARRTRTGSGTVKMSTSSSDIHVTKSPSNSDFPSAGKSTSSEEEIPVTLTEKQEKRREQSRSWDDRSKRFSISTDPYVPSPSHASVTLVTVTIDENDISTHSDSTTTTPRVDSTSASSSARSSYHDTSARSTESEPPSTSRPTSRPSSGEGIQLHNHHQIIKDPNSTSPVSPIASPPTSGRIKASSEESLPGSPPSETPPSQPGKASASSTATQSQNTENLKSIASATATCGTSASSPSISSTSAGTDSPAPSSSSSTAPPSSQHRMKRRAAVFQKASDRHGELHNASSTGVVDEQTAMEEAVNIWDEPKEEHIIFEKVAPAPNERTAGERDTVLLNESPASGSSATSSSSSMEVVAGTLNQLVKHLTSAKGVDGRALQTFLLTYTSFTTPKVLLDKLMQRYAIPKSKMEPKSTSGEGDPAAASTKSPKDIEAVCRQKQLRVINFLRKWLDLCFLDLTEDLINTVFQFCEQLRAEGASSLAVLIDNALLTKLSGLAKRKLTHEQQPPPAPIIPRRPTVSGSTMHLPSLTFLEIDPLELARQITLIDYELFGQIRSSELLNQSWNKPKQRHRSPHVLELIQRFNTLSKWLCGLILHTENLKDRIKVMQHVVALGRSLLQLNNFNALMAVLSALQNSAVYRLNQTKEGIGSKAQKTIAEWTTLMDPRQNSANYKVALSAAKPPAVPYLGLYLSALTFIEEGNAGRLHGLINFKKCRLMSKVIVNLLQYQIGKRYNLVVVDSIRDIIMNLGPAETDDELYELSLIREPRIHQPQ